MLAERLTHPLLPAVRAKPEPSLPMTADQYHYQQRALRTYQRRFDDALCTIGWRAPAPVLGQSELDYQREVLRAIKQTFLQNHELYKVQMRQLDADAIEPFTLKVIDAALSEYNNPMNVPVGAIEPRGRFDEWGKLQCIDWIGRECFTKQMGRPGRSGRIRNPDRDPGWFVNR
jgi:hypothetical protein